MNQVIPFNNSWTFKKETDTSSCTVTLPHTVQVEPMLVDQIYQGRYSYQKRFTCDAEWKGHKVLLEIKAVMNRASVHLNGKKIAEHTGGYLPFIADLSSGLDFGGENLLEIEASNFDDSAIPPGRPYRCLDFCYYGGLYRGVELHVLPQIRVSHHLEIDEPGGGGITFETLSASKEHAEVQAEVMLRNDTDRPVSPKLEIRLLDAKRRVVATSVSSVEIATNSLARERVLMTIENPSLWHPLSPSLYSLEIDLSDKDQLIQAQRTTVGIRTFEITRENGLRINGEPFFARGANRHQEHPWIGNAIPPAADRRDAMRIKKSGFDYVRLSHYPQSEAFMHACDELGLLVMDAMPGWQFFGNEAFQEQSFNDIRRMARRDKNHPAVFLWETCLNEAPLTDAWCQKAHDVLKEELPGKNRFTCGYHDAGYDVFLGNSAHGDWGHGCAPYYYLNPDESSKRKTNRGKPVIVSEYGDWEYYANNAGFNQELMSSFLPDAITSRQRRKDGETRLRKQADNFIEAHNKNLGLNVIGDGIWVMFDYNRGNHDDLETSGVMDIVRLPKFGTYFFQSQRNIDDPFGEPVVFIADYWKNLKTEEVSVYSNCEELELFINGRSLGRQTPHIDDTTEHLPHPPFLFKDITFEAGSIEAVGFVEGKPCKKHVVRTPQNPAMLILSADLQNIPLAVGELDAVFVHAIVADKQGTLVPDARLQVEFEIEGPGRIIHSPAVGTEAGIATIMVETSGETGTIRIRATCPFAHLAGDELTIL